MRFTTEKSIIHRPALAKSAVARMVRLNQISWFDESGFRGPLDWLELAVVLLDKAIRIGDNGWTDIQLGIGQSLDPDRPRPNAQSSKVHEMVELRGQ